MLIGRHAGNGRFKPVSWARKHKRIAVVERIKTRGRRWRRCR